MLTELARLLQALSRETDIAARFGGEESIVLLEGADQLNSVLIAERYREAIQATLMGNLNITASIGVATMTAEDTAETLTDKADQALYQSKTNGRNRVTH